jgi:AraC-like DNA-binding protein
VTVVLGFGRAMRASDATNPDNRVEATSLVRGMSTTATLSERRGPLAGVAITLTPLAAYRLLGAPMDELAHRYVGIGELTGRRTRQLIEQLADCPDWQSRFALLDHSIATRLADSQPHLPEVGLAWTELLRSAGRIPVHRLAAETGLSRRQLERRFLEQVGLPPKSLAQVLRLQEALRHKRDGLSWAEASAVAGYHDQAHFARTFKSMMGCTPGQFYAVRTGVGQDGPLAPACGDRLSREPAA